MPRLGERSPQDWVNFRLAQILLDLHRCEHGRQQGDDCSGCGGHSRGNLLLRPGSVIGHTLYGQEIGIPAWEDHNDPEKWVRRR